MTRAILQIFYKLRVNSAVIFNYFFRKNKIKFMTRAILQIFYKLRRNSTVIL